MSNLKINIAQAAQMIPTAIQSNVVPILRGSPACGKSSVVKQIAEQFNLKLLDLRLAQCDPTDLLGFPRVLEQPTYELDEDSGKYKETGKTVSRATYAPMTGFPIEGDRVPDGYEGWLLFLDELPLADPSVQKAAYRLILDREVGEHKLHKNVAIVAAGNLETDNAMVEEMSTALQSRMLHLEMYVDKDEWLKWASKTGIDHRITAYIGFRPDHLYTFNPNHTDNTYAAPRTWEFASNLLKNIGNIHDDSARTLLAGTVSEGVAREFITFSRIFDKLVTIDQIKKDPTGITIPDEPSVLYALTGTIGHEASSENIGQLMKFIDRLPLEFQVITLRECIGRNPGLEDSDEIAKWTMENANRMF